MVFKPKAIVFYKETLWANRQKLKSDTKITSQDCQLQEEQEGQTTMPPQALCSPTAVRRSLYKRATVAATVWPWSPRWYPETPPRPGHHSSDTRGYFISHICLILSYHKETTQRPLRWKQIFIFFTAAKELHRKDMQGMRCYEMTRRGSQERGWSGRFSERHKPAKEVDVLNLSAYSIRSMLISHANICSEHVLCSEPYIRYWG